MSEVLVYARQSRESLNNGQASLSERMQEYKRQIDHGSGQYLNGSKDAPIVDGMQPLARRSHKEIESVIQSYVEGKVLALYGCHSSTFRSIFYYL